MFLCMSPTTLAEDISLGGDYFGDESAIQDYEVSACEVMCNLLSSILIKTQFEQLCHI